MRHILPDGDTTARLRKQTGGFAFGNPDSGAARYLPLPPFAAPNSPLVTSH
jgi:hypothetical protein